MATLNVILDSRKTKPTKRYPLKVRISHLRKSVYISLQIFLPKKEWDEKKQRVRSNNHLFKKINHRINLVVTQLQEIILDLEKDGLPYSAEKVKSIHCKAELPTTVFEYCEHLISQLRSAKKFGNARVYNDATRKLIGFLGGKEIKFEDIDYSLLTRFEHQMLKNGLKINSISVHLRSIRAIYNKAINDGIVQRDTYPFYRYKIKSQRTRSRSLTDEELKLLINLPLKVGTAKWIYRQLFIFSFAFIGMSFIDMAYLKKANIENNRLKYRRRKTGTLYSIGINAINRQILNSFIAPVDNECQFLLPIVKTGISEEEAIYEYSREAYHRCNKNLKLISKESGLDISISTYWSRYTWANIARKLGYSKDMIAEALGHSYGNRVTGIYLDDYPNEVIDEMNYQVLRHIFE